MIGTSGQLSLSLELIRRLIRTLTYRKDVPINAGTADPNAPDAGFQMLRGLLWIISSCLRNPGLENIFCIYTHGVPGKRPECPLEGLRESGDCNTSAQNWVEVGIGGMGTTSGQLCPFDINPRETTSI